MTWPRWADSVRPPRPVRAPVLESRSVEVLELDVLEPDVVAVVLKAEVAGPVHVLDRDLGELVLGAVGTLAGLRPRGEIDRRDLLTIEDDVDLRTARADRHVVPLARGLLGVDPR